MKKTIIFSVVLFLAGHHPSDQNTPPDTARKNAWQEYLKQLDDFKKTARSAYAAEQAREKQGDCPTSATTSDIVTCLGKEVDKTTVNYRAYADAGRSIEGLTAPGETPTQDSPRRPLTSQESVNQFDAVESLWQAYKKAQCTAAYDAYRSGTIAPIMRLSCELMLTRNHLRELDSIYQVNEAH